MIDKVVVSVDGSEASRAATDWCVSNLAPGTKVIAVCGISDLGEVVLGLPGLDPPGERGLQESLETRWCEPLRRAGLECEPRLVHHRPIAALFDVLAEEHPDLVVVGKAAHNAVVDGLLPGSPMPLVHRMPCPVVVVPVDAGTRSDDTAARRSHAAR